MPLFRVLVVEDDPIIATDLVEALLVAGCDVCGVAASEAEALRIGETTMPQFAVVDLRLAPGDGRMVARELVDRYRTAGLLATSHNQREDLTATGALGCLPKPYATEDVIAALEVVRDLRDGRPVTRLPGHMLALNCWA